MPRNISFALTTNQFKARTKTVTRRLRWLNAKVGDILQGVEKGMGLKPGEKVVKLGLIRIVDARREPLGRMIEDPEYGKAEAIKEGFHDLTGEQFVTMFCTNMKVDPSELVTRIEFEYLEEQTQCQRSPR